MEVTIESVLLGASILLLVSIASSKISSKLVFLPYFCSSWLACWPGQEGPGGFYFDNAQFAQSLGVLALVFILIRGRPRHKLDQRAPRARHGACARHNWGANKRRTGRHICRFCVPLFLPPGRSCSVPSYPRLMQPPSSRFYVPSGD